MRKPSEILDNFCNSIASCNRCRFEYLCKDKEALNMYEITMSDKLKKDFDELFDLIKQEQNKDYLEEIDG